MLNKLSELQVKLTYAMYDHIADEWFDSYAYPERAINVLQIKCEQLQYDYESEKAVSQYLYDIIKEHNIEINIGV